MFLSPQGHASETCQQRMNPQTQASSMTGSRNGFIWIHGRFPSGEHRQSGLVTASRPDLMPLKRHEGAKTYPHHCTPKFFVQHVS